MVKEYIGVASTEGCDIERIIFPDEVKYRHSGDKTNKCDDEENGPRWIEDDPLRDFSIDPWTTFGRY